jgi:hypothetical protein
MYLLNTFQKEITGCPGIYETKKMFSLSIKVSLMLIAKVLIMANWSSQSMKVIQEQYEIVSCSSVSIAD